MFEIKTHPVSKQWAEKAWCDRQSYERMYRHSIDSPGEFWAEQAKRVDWITPFKSVKDTSFSSDAHIRWFEGGRLNASANCIDRHLATRAEQTAIIWEGDNPAESKHITYAQLHEQVCRTANVLRKYGVKKGDRVTLYLPMIPELAVSVLACARIGAVHSVVFGGFSPESLAKRIQDCASDFIITADEAIRGGKHVPLKSNVDVALAKCPDVRKVLVVRRTGGTVVWDSVRDLWYEEECNEVSAECAPEPMDAEDPLFILYTSGSTGSPKGVLHTTGGYLLYAAITHQYVFDYHDGDIYWCTADIGWITGHSYIVYGPLANGATTVMFEGIPTYPSASRFWEICDKHQVNIFYTAPTAIRALMRLGDKYVTKTQRNSLRLLGSVGEPINPEAWEWYHQVVGEKRCPVVDTWWQTETGGILLSPLPGATTLKPGSVTKPFFGVQPALVDDQGKVIEGAGAGNLVLLDSWPGQMRTIYGNHERFQQSYFGHYPGMYYTGDGARRDEDGDYWVTGRIDDVINVSGHRIGTAEIESSLVAHDAVSEAAVVGIAHEIKGQSLYAFVTLHQGQQATDSTRAMLTQWVRKQIGPIATIEHIQFAEALPKTRSGKIMRRILRKIANQQTEQLGDTSTLADPSVVQALIDDASRPR